MIPAWIVLALNSLFVTLRLSGGERRRRARSKPRPGGRGEAGGAGAVPVPPIRRVSDGKQEDIPEHCGGSQGFC